MELEIGLTKNDRKEISDGLHVLLANLYAMYLKTQNYHWNIIGQEFYSLHLLLEKQYEEMAQALDEIAERIRALGYYVEASFSHFKSLSAVKEPKQGSAKEFLGDLVESHQVLIRQARDLADKAEKKADAATVDLLSRRLGSHEKMLWMLLSQLSS